VEIYLTVIIKLQKNQQKKCEKLSILCVLYKNKLLFFSKKTGKVCNFWRMRYADYKDGGRAQVRFCYFVNKI